MSKISILTTGGVHYTSASFLLNSRFVVFSARSWRDPINDFPSIKDSSLLFDVFKLSPNFPAGSPSDEFERWIQTIDAADPNDPALDEDNNFKQWGSVNGTCRLIAALVKTCKMARKICQVNQREMSTSFIADIYLDQTIETLWKLWAGYKAKNPNVDQVPPLIGSASSLPSPALPLPPPPSSGSENVPTPQDPGSAVEMTVST
ncbi:hypothetical protein Agabi119p4_9034 [Agaricus bisporus var. burnettii]|uniref:Uncharacterized protein n=1 Tax=Agaricus bisporus var. burnettii TaxID=192524 RepID=A0A8H7C5Q4_AGABI|nr:hypothetical protein Agabi119p4_9034 [Agaricus bisporus var. burnettii]